jgi:hypothetical protein
MSSEEKSLFLLLYKKICELHARIVILETKLLNREENKDRREERIFLGIFLFSLFIVTIPIGVVLYQACL